MAKAAENSTRTCQLWVGKGVKSYTENSLFGLSGTGAGLGKMRRGDFNSTT